MVRLFLCSFFIRVKNYLVMGLFEEKKQLVGKIGNKSHLGAI